MAFAPRVVASPLAVIQLHGDWISELRDHFLASGSYVVSEGRLWVLDTQALLWRGHSPPEAGKLVSTHLDSHTFQRMTAGAWKNVLNSAANRREVLNAIWDYAPVCKPGFFNDLEPGLAIGREWVSVTAAGISRVPLTADHRARSTLNIELPHTSEPPKHYLAALQRVFGTDADGVKKLAAFQEFLGACRTGVVTEPERCLIMPGGGSNGKSTVIMGGIEALFHPSEIRSIEPNFLNQEYYLAQLRDAAINFMTELPAKTVNCTERFKQSISGEDVTGREPGGMPVTFRPVAGHLFACNNFPKLSDNSHGMRRRLLVLRCDTTFAKTDGTRVDLVAKFKKEAPQILLWALEGAVRLQARKDYDFPESHFIEENEWRESDNKALQFITDCTKGVKSGWTRASKVFAEYQEWHKKKGFAWNEKMDNRAFGAALRHVQGFDTKEKNYGKDYNVELKPRHEWKEIYWGDEATIEEPKKEEKS